MNQIHKPSNLGPPCVGFSLMGQLLREQDASYQAHESHYEMTKKEEFDVQFIENVPEYPIESVHRHLPPDTWEVRSVILDPRLFGQKAARPRKYFLCWRKAVVQWDESLDLMEIIKCLRTCPVIDPINYFWKKLPPTNLSMSQDLCLFKTGSSFDNKQ